MPHSPPYLPLPLLNLIEEREGEVVRSAGGG
jgi:hypothetical protein